jgi:CxxC motif-containing protein
MVLFEVTLNVEVPDPKEIMLSVVLVFNASYESCPVRDWESGPTTNWNEMTWYLLLQQPT